MTENIKEDAEIYRATGIVGSATLLSRVLGFIRDVLIASVVGAGMNSDAFFVAYRIPNFMRKLFAEGSLTLSFIPVYAGVVAGKGRGEAMRMSLSFFRLILVSLSVLSFIGILFAPVLVGVIAPGYMDDPEKFDLTVRLARMMFPYVIFVGLVALSMGILNSWGYFAMPAMAPVVLNIVMIFVLVYGVSFFPGPCEALAFAVLAGGFLQFLVQCPVLAGLGFRFELTGPLFHSATAEVLRKMVPSVFGASVFQINLLVGTVVATFLGEGSVSFLYYADRLVQFPLAILGMSAATAAMPSISRMAAREDLAGVKDTFLTGLKFVTFMTLPASAGLIVLRGPLVSLLFERGAFDAAATAATAEALLYYALGIWFCACLRMSVSVLGALDGATATLKAGLVSVAVHLVLCVLLVRSMGHGGIAMAASLAAGVNLLLLLVSFHFKFGGTDWKGCFGSFGRSLLLTLVMAAAVEFLKRLYFSFPGTDALILKFAGVMALVVSGVLVYALSAAATGNTDLKMIYAALIKGRGKR